MTIQSEQPFLGAKSNGTSRNNWKSLFEANFSTNSNKTIRLFTLDFYELIVDEAKGKMNMYSSNEKSFEDSILRTLTVR